jgi:hypothetical protein
MLASIVPWQSNRPTRLGYHCGLPYASDLCRSKTSRDTQSVITALQQTDVFSALPVDCFLRWIIKSHDTARFVPLRIHETMGPITKRLNLVKDTCTTGLHTFRWTTRESSECPQRQAKSLHKSKCPSIRCSEFIRMHILLVSFPLKGREDSIEPSPALLSSQDIAITAPFCAAV